MKISYVGLCIFLYVCMLWFVEYIFFYSLYQIKSRQTLGMVQNMANNIKKVKKVEIKINEN